MPATDGRLDPGASSASERRAVREWVALQLALALAPQRAFEALGPRGDPARALRNAAPGNPPEKSRVEGAVARLRNAGSFLLPCTASGYPARLAAIPDPPPVLAVRGDAGALSGLCVAVVGARAATVEGLATARSLARELASAGAVVVSGLARGIDASAHEGALAAGGRTVAVQACGPEQVYPPEHRALAVRIAASGCVVTEMPPGTPPRGEYFPLRNRIISALCRAVVVVEARERSGSLVTARHALSQGIDVLAVPGSILAPTSRGSNRLLRDGAAPVLDVSDVLGAMGLPARPRPPAAVSERPPRQAAVVSALEPGALTRDELARALGWTASGLAVELLELELAGVVREDRDGRLRLIV